jgi:hypothetical protein
MKKAILFGCVIFWTELLFGQEFRVSIAPTYNVFHNKYVNEKPYGSPKLGTNFNLDYIITTTKKLEFGLGLGYQSSSVLKVIPIGVSEYIAATEKINLFSFSLKSVYKLSKEFYLSLDPSVDIQTNHDPIQTTENQSGLGLSFGVGGNFRLNNYLLFNVEPRLWMHNLISFHNQDAPFRLSNVGINLGLVFGHKSD